VPTNHAKLNLTKTFSRFWISKFNELVLDIQQLFDRHVFGDQKSETFAWLLRKSRLNGVQRHCEIMKVCRRGRLGNARNVVQTMGPCFLVLMLLWSAKSSCGTSRQPENSFVVLQHGLSPRLSPHHVFLGASQQTRNSPAFVSKVVPTPTISALAVSASALLCSVLCGRTPLKKRLEVVRCHAGFQGSGLTGKWGCYKTEGDIDGYWKATGLPWLARKGLQLMDWGAGKNQNIREFLQDGNSIKMEYSFDGPGLGGLGFTETYTVGDGIQQITRMGGAKILVDPAWESESVLRIQNMNPAKQTKGWVKTLISGRDRFVFFGFVS